MTLPNSCLDPTGDFYTNRKPNYGWYVGTGDNGDTIYFEIEDKYYQGTGSVNGFGDTSSGYYVAATLKFTNGDTSTPYMNRYPIINCKKVEEGFPLDGLKQL